MFTIVRPFITACGMISVCPQDKQAARVMLGGLTGISCMSPVLSETDTLTVLDMSW